VNLLLLNANTTDAMTRRMVELAAPIAGPAVQIDGVTARFGASYIATRVASAIAGHAALETLAAALDGGNPRGYRAVALACFGDPGLLALREFSPIPVIGMAEASLHAAARIGPRIGIVTGGERWVPMLEEFADLLGFGDRLVAVRATALTGGEIAADPARAEESLARLADSIVADSVILGGAGLAGLAARLQSRVGVKLLDSLTCLIEATIAAARDAESSPKPLPAVGSRGLAEPLAALLLGGAPP
jgi:Asp/Glu/hydantoin racemase